MGHGCGWGAAALAGLVVAGGLTIAATPVAAAGTGVIIGVVSDEETGAPLAGMCVAAWDENLAIGAESGVTGADGRYVISAVPEGAYQLAFQDCRPVPLYREELYADRPVDIWTRFGDVVWVATNGTTTVDASLRLGGAITGTATWAHNGRPAATCGAAFRALPADHWIWAYFLGGWPEWPTCVGQADVARFREPGEGVPGVFVVGGIPPGDYVLGFGDWEVRLYGGTTPDTATVVSVAAGRATTFDVVLAATPTVPEACEWGEAEPADARFGDVAGSAHAFSIGCAAHFGVVQGTGVRTFTPAGRLTRGQAATMVDALVAHTGVAVPAPAPDAFDDDDGSPHEAALDRLAALGVMSGTGPRAASPSATTSRAQLAAIAAAAYEVVTGFELRSSGDHFADDDGSAHESRIDEAATAGLVVGVSAAALRPGAPVTRAQAATVVMRLLDLIEDDIPGGRS